jgi:hypothetical protein
MKRLTDVTSSWRLGQNTGMHYDARDFRRANAATGCALDFLEQAKKLLYGTWPNRLWFSDSLVCSAPVGLPVRNGEAGTRSLNFVPQLFRGAKQTQMILTGMSSRLCDEARTREFRSWSDYTGKLPRHLRIQNCVKSVVINC